MRRLPISLLVWIVAVLGAVELSSAVAGGIHTTSGSSDSADAAARSTGSLFTPGGFGHALSTVRSRVGVAARAETVAVYPGYLSANVVRGATETDVISYTDGRYVAIDSTYMPTSDPLLPLAKLRPGDTAAVAARLQHEAGVPLAQLRYMIPELDPSTHRFEWLVYLVPGAKAEYFQVPSGRGRIMEEVAGKGLQPVRG